MSDLQRACASMLCIGFPGTSLTSELAELIDRGASAVVLFSRNVRTPSQVRELCADIKQRARRPILIAVDQEGGRVMRLRDGFTPIPTMRQLGRCADPRLARDVGRLLARELRAVNIDLDFAPVLDVDTNPCNPVIGDRSLGPDPDLVARLGSEILLGLQETGVAACAKHFPGHGDTSQDSHFVLPRLPHSIDRLSAIELPPFQAAVDAGLAAVMTSHIIFESIDPRFPATMSHAILDGLLRRRLRFDGVIISDDLEMKAIADHFGIEEATVRSAGAGVDLLAICHRPDLQFKALDALIGAVERGDLPRQQVDAAAQRIARLVQRFARPAERGPVPDFVGSPAHRAIADQVLQLSGDTTPPDPHDPTEPL